MDVDGNQHDFPPRHRLRDPRRVGTIVVEVEVHQGLNEYSSSWRLAGSRLAVRGSRFAVRGLNAGFSSNREPRNRELRAASFLLSNVEIDDPEGQRDGSHVGEALLRDYSREFLRAAERCRPTPAGRNRRCVCFETSRPIAGST